MIDISFVQLIHPGYEYALNDSSIGEMEEYMFFQVDGSGYYYVYPPMVVGEHYNTESTIEMCYILENEDNRFFFAVNQVAQYNLVTFKGEVFKRGERKGRVKSCYYKKDLEPRCVPTSKARKNVRKRA